MKFVPKSLTRYAGSSALKLRASSPTLLVVTGVVGLGATAVLAARATRNLEPIIENHQKSRIQLEESASIDKRTNQKALLSLYTDTAVQLTKLYGTTMAVGMLSAGSILYGHKILHGRHLASMAAYSGIAEQFKAYRGRVAKTLGDDVEQGIFEGAHGEWIEDPEHPEAGAKLAPVWEEGGDAFLRPWFEGHNANWVDHAESNFLFLKGVQQHANNILQIKGYIFLNDVLKMLNMPAVKEGQAAGWVYGKGSGDDFVDFGFMTGRDPVSVGFRNHVEKSVQLNFNIDGLVWDLAFED